MATCVGVGSKQLAVQLGARDPEQEQYCCAGVPLPLAGIIDGERAFGVAGKAAKSERLAGPCMMSRVVQELVILGLSWCCLTDEFGSTVLGCNNASSSSSAEIVGVAGTEGVEPKEGDAGVAVLGVEVDVLVSKTPALNGE